MSEEKPSVNTTNTAPTCLSCNKNFANLKSLATHRRKFHTNSDVKLNDDNLRELPTTLEELNKPTKSTMTSISHRMKRSEISPGSLCYRLTPRIDMCDVVEILNYFTDLENSEMRYLSEDEVLFLTALVKEDNILKVYNAVRDNTDIVRKIIKKINLAS